VQVFHVAAFVKDLQEEEFEPPTVKQHLTALRGYSTGS